MLHPVAFAAKEVLAGNLLTYESPTKKGLRLVYEAQAQSCANCPLESRCTASRRRTIARQS
ncbi:hypothetical protein GCM10010136_31480 [Limoniibacter endophyticus]|uniref:Transposase DDE domain-containing protein n=1 Tax=Limoniibacter endophyticus TaxID=1565040 RepID=A0A8J3DUR9_9HYPH|nr:hypothetical protein GCM10010136_31480 [Limoniibacter endophyticus]